MGLIDKAKELFSWGGGKKDFAGAAPDIEFYRGADDDELKGYVTDLYKQAFDHIKPLAEEWKKNREAYEAERHDLFAGAATLTLGGKQEEALYCSDIVADKIDNLTSMQVQGKPVVTPLPKVPEDFAQAWAALPPEETRGETVGNYVRKLWEKVFEDIRERYAVHTMNIKIVKDGRLCNHAPVKVTQRWSNETQADDVCVEIVQPEDFAIDPAATGLNDARYVMQRTYVPAYEAMTDYPNFKADIVANVIGTKTATRGTDNVATGGTETESRNLTGRVCVVEGYFRDNTMKTVEEPVYGEDEISGLPTEDVVKKKVRKYPTGRRLIFLEGGTILDDTPNPYSDFPYSTFTPCPVSWSPYGRNEATPLRHIQHFTDKILQQAFVNLKMVGNAKLVYLENALDDPDAITNEIAQKIPVKQLGAVSIIRGQGITGDSLSMFSLLRAEADNISGVNAPTEGRSVASLTSGRAIGLLQEQDNRKVRPSQDTFSEFNQRFWKQVADVVYPLYKKGRLLRVSDEDQIPIRLPFDLDECTEAPPDVKASSDTQFPIDPVSRFNMFTTLAQIPGPDGVPIIDAETLLRMVGMPGISDILRRRQQFVTAQTMQGAAGQLAPQPNAQAGPPMGARPQPAQSPMDRGMGGLTPTGGMQV